MKNETDKQEEQVIGFTYVYKKPEENQAEKLVEECLR